MADNDTTRVAKARQKARERGAAARSKAGNLSKTHAIGFVDFVRTQGVVGLAIGLAIGTAAGATVKVLVESFITPIVRLIVGTNQKLESNVWHVDLWGRQADFQWGAALSSLITLLATVLVVYWFVHIFKLDRLDKKKD